MAKKQIICDTDVMIDYLDNQRKRHPETKKILEEQIELDNIVLSAITGMELQLGAVSKSDLRKITAKLSRFNLALINEEITFQNFELISTYRLSHGLTIPDGIIAATSLVSGLELFTYNKKDFKFIKDLNLFDPLAD